MPSDRHSEGLMMSLSVRENAAVNALNKLTSGIFVSRKKETEVVHASLQSIDLFRILFCTIVKKSLTVILSNSD